MKKFEKMKGILITPFIIIIIIIIYVIIIY